MPVYLRFVKGVVRSADLPSTSRARAAARDVKTIREGQRLTARSGLLRRRKGQRDNLQSSALCRETSPARSACPNCCRFASSGVSREGKEGRGPSTIPCR